MWYRKRTDPKAMYVARMIGEKALFDAIAEVLHVDDLTQVIKAFGEPKLDLELLFEPIDGPPRLFNGDK